MTKRDAIERYKQGISAYGWFTLAYMINKYEEVGDFEECVLITKAMTEYMSEYSMEFPTKLSEQSLKLMCLEFVNQGLAHLGEVALLKMPIFADKVREFVKVGKWD